MSRRLATAAAVVAASLASLVPAGSALADTAPTPLSPDDAAALIAAPGVDGTSPTVVVDPSTALAAGSLPGATTYVDPDFSTDTTTALASLKRPAAGLTTLLRTFCWASSAWHEWGTWPYQQRITDTTYWCAVYGGKVTYRTSSVAASGTLCGVGWRTSQLIAGGGGYPFFTMRSSAGFACPTVIPWITLHPSHYVDVRRDDRGNTSIAGSA